MSIFNGPLEFIQWNLVNTNTFKAKYLLIWTTLISPGIITPIHLATVKVKFLLIWTFFDGPVEFILTRFDCISWQASTVTCELFATDAMVAEVLEAVHHLDAAYAAFYTGMVTEALQDSMASLMNGTLFREHPLLASLFLYSNPSIILWFRIDSFQPFIQKI